MGWSHKYMGMPYDNGPGFCPHPHYQTSAASKLRRLRRVIFLLIKDAA